MTKHRKMYKLEDPMSCLRGFMYNKIETTRGK